MISRSLKRAFVASAIAALAIMPTAAPAQAAPEIPIDWTVDATSTLAKLNQTVHIEGGTFKGAYDLGTGQLTGDLNLPKVTSRLDIGSLPLANITMKMEQAERVTGTVDLATMTAHTKSKLNVRIPEIRPVLLPFINLVRTTCMTSKPVEANLSGPVNLAGDSTFTATYTMPKLKDCGWGITEILNLLVPGEGNTMTATFGPK